MQKFLETGNFNSITNKKLREIIYIPKIDFENPEEVEKYDEVVKIANRLIELEKEHTIDISLQKKGESEIMDVHSQAFPDLMKSTNFHREESPIGKQLVVDGEWYMVMGNVNENVNGETVGEMLEVVIVDNEAKEEEKKKLNERIDEIVQRWYV